ncbi:IclR family transcriptional regulator [Burkholderia sp. Ax-1719]|uniref:IclR family transcriptional regulator n=1 Tax=Burkholderia sp. Ax-1719 TaxID=2608334 RepID=UPI001421DAF4|nr:IclR family transcriptional regulator [Burkholderia sp. Ax-1719]NIE64450.1 IclR family transcriptional regulator [Burkholderia sp. Ax-1719]
MYCSDSTHVDAALLTAPRLDRATRGAKPGPIVMPFARALALLCAFTPNDRWLSNGELSERAGIPPSTVTRLTRTLVALGYLHYDGTRRRFRLGPSALALGYRAAAEIEIHEAAHQRMRRFAEQHHVHVHLCARNRLDVVVIDSCCTSAIPASLQPGIGTRLGLASSAAGWALLASLPDIERDYLLRSAEQLPACDWSQKWGHLGRRPSEAIGQVREGGFCVALGQSGQPMTMVAAPVRLPGEAPLAVSCMGPSMLVGRARSERELGPALVRMAQDIQHARTL